MIYDDYINYCNEYTLKYGKKTVVFMQIGDFFELYAVDNDVEKQGCDIYTICDMCNIQVSKKNKAVLENSRSNPLMAGFPLSAISKFVQIVISNGYTAVLIRQTTPPPNPKREVTEVISPSTTLAVTQKEGVFLMVVYWEQSNIGIGIVDLTTGKSWIYESYGDIEFSKDEVTRFTNLYQPKEVINIENEENLKHFLKPSYQNLILEKVFGKTGVITPLEMLQFERYTLATVAFCYMIQFAYEHNEAIIKDISIPVHLKNNKHLILEANCIYQLNLDSLNAADNHLLRLLNRTVTSFGSRMFRDYLFNPIIDKEELEKRYDKIAFYQENNLYKEVQSHLQPILDLERIIRKIGLGRFQPCEWISMLTSFENAKAVFNLLNKKSEKSAIIIMNDFTSTLDIDECSKYNMNDINTSIFKKGIYPEIDSLTTELKQSFAFLEDIRIKITNIGSGESTLCRLDCNDRDGYHLTITKKRWELAQSIKPMADWKAKPVSATSSVLRLSNKEIDAVSDTIVVAQRKMSVLNVEYYIKYLEQFYEKHKSVIKEIVNELAEIDVFSTNAKNATEYKYTRPVILDNPSKSSISIKGLRHPIIERLNNNTEYVSNDIDIENGTLLYGINASGKSSLMKSVGINVIMAQSGMFVASSNTTLTPYWHIFTRIAGADNIYRGLSTFTVEMLELKNILNRCDEHSLILGDELCAGTESVSAVAIVASGIEYLLHKNSSFIFATHLHELLDIDFIKRSKNLSILHLHIKMENGKIIYDRKLKEGGGSKIYGLEVCRFLKMNDRFLDNANVIRKKIQEIPMNVVEPKLSKYNSDVYVSSCSLCGDVATETHHIKQQKDADENGYVGDIHKDAKANLVVLCEKCHLKTHHGNQKIAKTVMTSEGVEHVFEEVVLEKKETLPLKEHLHYTIQGWKYRFKTTEVWKKLIPSNYEKVFKKLSMPMNTEAISKFLEENQSAFLVF